jgi:hypothetical protein
MEIQCAATAHTAQAPVMMHDQHHWLMVTQLLQQGKVLQDIETSNTQRHPLLGISSEH